MNTFKITNISKLVGKRDSNYNRELIISYVNNMRKKNIKIKPDETVYLTINKLPISVHLLRVKNLVSVVEVSDAELKKAIPKKTSTKKPVAEIKSPAKKAPTKKTTPKKASAKKAPTKKKNDEGYFAHDIKD